MTKTTARNTALVDDYRGALAMDATFEIEHLCKMIIDKVNADPRSEFLAFRGVTMRIAGLNGALMSAIGDSGATNEEIRQEIHGRDL